MDGYAVRAEETRGATETRPILLEVGRPAFYVDTGDPLPPGTNAVIMVEDVQRMAADEGDQQAIEVLAAVAPWQHVRPMGEDMVATELILPANHRLRPQDIGAAAGSGHATLACAAGRGSRSSPPAPNWSRPAPLCNPATSSSTTRWCWRP